MKIDMKITEDTLTNYLTELQSNFEESKQNIVGNASAKLAWEISELAPIWEGSDPRAQMSNHALSESPLHIENWHFTTGSQTILDIFVSGMDNVVSFFEFREDSDGFKPPEMDYAYYQETGIHNQKMQTPRERFFVKRATVTQAANTIESMQKSLQLILEGKKIPNEYQDELF